MMFLNIRELIFKNFLAIFFIFINRYDLKFEINNYWCIFCENNHFNFRNMWTIMKQLLFISLRFLSGVYSLLILKRCINWIMNAIIILIIDWQNSSFQFFGKLNLFRIYLHKFNDFLSVFFFTVYFRSG